MHSNPSPPKDFKKYEQLGSYHYNKTLRAKSWRDFDARLAARYWNAVRLLNPREGERILDAGSGEGVASVICCRLGGDVSAVDLDDEAIRLGERIRADEGFSAERLKFHKADLSALPFSPESFDGALSLEVIEHIAATREYLMEIHRLLKPGGRLVISTPLRRPDGVIKDPYHVREYLPDELAATVAEVFARVEVLSAWPGRLNRWYETNFPMRPVAKLTRGAIRWFARRGMNIFERPVPFDPGCPILLAIATK